MIDEKKIKEAEARVKQYLAEGTIKTKQKQEFTAFFLSNARKSLETANVLFDLSTKRELQEITGYLDFDGLLWVVNASYYAMFYMARALLEREGIKLRSDLSIHMLTFDALVNFFYINSKLQKRLIEDFAEAKEEAGQILGKQKADQLIEEYYFEKEKRATFTYNTGEVLLKAKANTSLERARRFSEELRKIIEK